MIAKIYGTIEFRHLDLIPMILGPLLLINSLYLSTIAICHSYITVTSQLFEFADGTKCFRHDHYDLMSANAYKYLGTQVVPRLENHYT